VLLGQNVNSYHDISAEALQATKSRTTTTTTSPTDGRPMSSSSSMLLSNDGFRSRIKRPEIMGGYRFVDLVEAVSDISPELRVRFTSPHPKDYPPDLLHLMAERPNVCSQLHMPAQSGSSSMLKRMKRGYTREAYIELIDTVHDIIPDVALSSDFIAGFCDETESEHADTLSLLEYVEYEQAFLFAYSMREKTHASRTMQDNVPPTIKQRRLQELIDVFRDRIHAKNVRVETGRLRLVLVEGPTKKQNEHAQPGTATWHGRTDQNKRVLFSVCDVDNDGPIMTAQTLNERCIQRLLECQQQQQPGTSQNRTKEWMEEFSDSVTLVPGDYAVVYITEAKGHTLRGRLLWKTTLANFSNFESNHLMTLDPQVVDVFKENLLRLAIAKRNEGIPSSSPRSETTSSWVSVNRKLAHQKRAFSTRSNVSELTDDDDTFFEDDDDDDGDSVLDENNSPDDDDDDSSSQPWKELLGIPGRASWRASSDPPESLIKAMHQILQDGDRTPKQLQRAHRKVLAIHTDLEDMRERERRRMVNGGTKRRSASNDDSLTHKKRNPYSVNDEDTSLKPVYYGFDETLATLKHRLVPNYAVAKRVLAECQSLLGGPKLSNWRPRRIVDFGIGCGSASAAAVDLFRDDQTGQTSVEWIHGIEPSVPMRECCRRLLEETERNFPGTRTSPRITFGNSLSPLSSSPDDTTDGSGTFDLALLTYTATDLTDVTSSLSAAALLFEKLGPNGVLVMVEPGTPDGFNSVRSVRNMLLDCCPPDDHGFEWDDRCHVLAPCTHNGICPMERHKKNFFPSRGKLGHDVSEEQFEDTFKSGATYQEVDLDSIELGSTHDLMMSETEAFNSSFCSFVQHIPGDATRRGEKFSYLVAQKQRFSKLNDGAVPNDSFQGDFVSKSLAKAFDAASKEDDDRALKTFKLAQEMRKRYLESDEDELGLELIRGTSKRQSMGRIIRAPIKKKGHVYVDYCVSPGRIIRSRITKAVSNNIAPGVFGAARKSRWGGLWPHIMGEASSGNPDK
jgi:ribosomal protein RSM22 (predicted rRNA methylase)